MNAEEELSSDLSKQVIESNFDKYYLGIKICREKELITQALILLYSAIDTMAWLIREKSKEDSDGKDFIEWFKKYLLPDSNLEGTANDFYASRCGIIHSNSPEARSIRKGNANPIYYCHGNANKSDLKELLIKTNRSNIVVINFDELFNAYNNAITKFKLDIDKSEELRALVFERGKKCFGIQKPHLIKALGNLFRNNKLTSR
jgi:hypothetical protein